MSLLQNILSFTGLFCKRDLSFNRSYYPKPPHTEVVNRLSCEIGETTLQIQYARLYSLLHLEVIFCKRATNYRALLLKMTYDNKASYESTPPCTVYCIWRSFHCTMWRTDQCHILHAQCREHLEILHVFCYVWYKY